MYVHLRFSINFLMIALSDLITDCLGLILGVVVHSDFTTFATLVLVCKQWKNMLHQKSRNDVYQIYQNHQTDAINCAIYTAHELYRKHIGKFHSSKPILTNVDHYISSLKLHQEIPKSVFGLMFSIEQVIKKVLKYYDTSNFSKVNIVNKELILWCVDSNGIHRTELEQTIGKFFPYVKKTACTCLCETLAEIIRVKYPNI